MVDMAKQRRFGVNPEVATQVSIESLPAVRSMHT